MDDTTFKGYAPSGRAFASAASALDNARYFDPHSQVASNSEMNVAIDAVPGSAATTYNLSIYDDNFAMMNSATDADWFAFYMDAGVTYSFDMNGAPGLDAYLQIFSFAATALASNDNASPDTTNARITYTPTSSGMYFIAASAKNGATGQYDIAWHDQAGQSADTAASLTVGASVKGLIEMQADEDWYAVTLTAGVTYNITINGYGSHALATPLAEIYNASQVFIDASADNGGAATLRFTPTSTGTYYVSASNYNDFNHLREGGQFAVSVEVDHDAYAGDATTTGHIAANGSVSSAIDTDGDADWFAVNLEAGHLYTWDLTGAGATPLSDPFLQLYNIYGQSIAADDDSGPGTSPHLSFYATESGTYYLSAEAFPNPSPYVNTGSYKLTMGPAAVPTVDKIGASIWDSGSLMVGTRVSGRIDTPNDHDWYAVTLTAGQGYDFDVTGLNGLDTFVGVYDAGGTLIAQNDDSHTGLDAHLDFEALTSGTYYISASTSGDHSYGDYSIKVSNGARPLLTDAINWGTKLNVTGGVVKVYFAASGEVFDGQTSHGWSDHEISQAMAALGVYSNYINLTFVQTTDASEAQFKLVTSTDLDDTVLGYMNPPGTTNAGVGVFAINSPAWTSSFGSDPLMPGGLGFDTLVHEFGHGLGLSHPFDGGGNAPVMTGVLDTYDYWGYGYQNQGVYTVMSYNDGWPGNYQIPYQTEYYHGWGESPMAIDVAALQAKYGANTTYHNGDDIYELATSSNYQTSFWSIWDTGGTDTLSAANDVYGGAVIDLRAATMYYSGDTAGGAPSYVIGQDGAITIDQGVVIENATGSRQGDTITGNDYANVIKGMGGADTIYGMGGNDSISLTLDINVSTDTVDGGAGTDTLTLDMAHTAFTGTFDGTMLSLQWNGAYINITNVETIVFTDGSYAFNKALNVAPVLSGTFAASISGNGQHVLTTSELGVSDLNSDALTFYVQTADKHGTTDFSGATQHGGITVNGAASNTFTSAQLAAGQVRFVQDGTADVPVSFKIAAFDGQAWSQTVTFSFVTAYNHGSYLFVAGTADNDTLSLADFGDGLGNDVMAGFVGDDTYIVDKSNVTIVEGAGDGADMVRASASYTLNDNVEYLTLTGSGNINGSGNALDNIINGNSGNNVLNGKAGGDQMWGGAGNDTYYVDSQNDSVWEWAGIASIVDAGGTDTVISSVDWTASWYIENITLTGIAVTAAGNELDNVLTGNASNNILTGNWGNDILNGGAGVDMLVGGYGNDTYYVDNSNDVVKEGGDAGTDIVYASASFSISGQNVENLTLTGSGNINATGNSLANSLTGNSGNNVLDGGTGMDTMIGGAGNDTYYVDSSADIVKEAANAGTDIVYASADFSINGQNVENLTLTGLGSLNATGNSLANILTGNSGNNMLDGGTGADTLIGGLGNDTYYVDNSADVVRESANAGTDIVYASANFSINGQHIENLTLTGAGNINATGNSLVNILTGSSGNNILDGGAGADTLIGGLGNDTYYVDNSADVVKEAANSGIDSVFASATFSINGQNVENLTLTGAGNINATGNSLGNILTGNSGNNVLDGGTGADTLIGGLGDDTYYVDNSADIVKETANAGTDIVYATVSFSINGQHIENLTLEGTGNISATGNSLDNTIIGNLSNNIIDGGAGNDTLDGGVGADTLIGGAGNDIYYVDNSADVVKEGANAGIDQVFASASFSISGQHIESLVLTGGANINATGNSLDNTIMGNFGNNIIDGGAGNDLLIGGLGNDIYVFGVHSGADIISGFSNDTIDLSAYSHGVTNGGGIVISQSGSDTVIDLGGGNIITINATAPGDLSGHIVW